LAIDCFAAFKTQLKHRDGVVEDLIPVADFFVPLLLSSGPLLGGFRRPLSNVAFMFCVAARELLGIEWLAFDGNQTLPGVSGIGWIDFGAGPRTPCPTWTRRRPGDVRGR
jgi:hypothetical protein